MFEAPKRWWEAISRSWNNFWLRGEMRRYESASGLERIWGSMRDWAEAVSGNWEHRKDRCIEAFLGLGIWGFVGRMARAPGRMTERFFGSLDRWLKSIRFPALARVAALFASLSGRADSWLFQSSKELGYRLRNRLGYQVAAVCAAVAATAAVGWGIHEYPVWKAEASLMVARRDFRSKSPDERNSIIRALRLNPDSAEVWRMYARYSEDSGLTGVEMLWGRAAALDPSDADSFLQCARTALAAGNLDLASDSLAQIPEGKRATAECAALEGEVARRRGLYAQAVEAYTRSVKLDPSRAGPSLILASLLSDSKDPQQRMRGITALEKFRGDANPRIQAEALRALLRAAAQLHDVAQLNGLSAALAAHPAGLPTDMGLILDAWRVGAPDLLARAVLAAQEKSASDPRRAAEVMSWFNAVHRSAESLAWCSKISPSVSGQPPASLAVAEAWRLGGDWQGLERWSDRTQWGKFAFIGAGYRALAASRMGDAKASDRFWTQAMDLSAKNPSDRYSLATLANNWGMTDKAIDIWWSLADNPNIGFYSLAALARHYRGTRDAAGLERAFYGLREISGNSDPRIENNFAYLAALTGNHAKQALATAQRIHSTNPENIHYAATLAFALMRAKRIPEALYEVRRILPASKDHPEIAMTCGLVLKAGGFNQAAVEQLRRVPLGGLTTAEEQMVREALAAAER